MTSKFDPLEEEFDPPAHDDGIKDAIRTSTDKSFVMYSPHPERGPLTHEDIEHLKGEPLDVEGTCYLVQDIELVHLLGDRWTYVVDIKQAGLEDV